MEWPHLKIGGKDTKNNNMRDIEHKLQCACVRWMRLSMPFEAGLLFAVPNGGARDAVTGARLKAEGVMAGVADLFLSIPNTRHHGLYIEMKTAKGVQSQSQKIFQQRVEAMGYRYAVVRSFEQFVAEIREYLNSRNIK